MLRVSLTAVKKVKVKTSQLIKRLEALVSINLFTGSQIQLSQAGVSFQI